MKQRERLAERAQRVLHAGLAIRFGRGVFGLEERPDGLRDVLGDPEYFLRNVSVLL
ncbi:MAG: hypothetical protein JSU89_02315 [Myxococcales bacterium]|nr:MAG: hypothetical protein JSU89_02315 [Myxococcales bacterium]